jgi:hypothetical protein
VRCNVPQQVRGHSSAPIGGPTKIPEYDHSFAPETPRPARLPQLIGSFAAIWDDMLPPPAEQIRAANLALLMSALG